MLQELPECLVIMIMTKHQYGVKAAPMDRSDIPDDVSPAHSYFDSLEERSAVGAMKAESLAHVVSLAEEARQDDA